MRLRNTSDEPVKVGGVTIEPGAVADVDLSADEWQRLCVEGPLAIAPEELVADDGTVVLPPRDVLARYGITPPDER